MINEASFVVRVSSGGGSGGGSGGSGSALDYERLRTVNLTLVAEEVAEDRRRTSIPLTIHIRQVKRFKGDYKFNNSFSSVLLYLKTLFNLLFCHIKRAFNRNTVVLN